MSGVKNHKVYFQDWGLISYEAALQRQFEDFNRIIEVKINNRARVNEEKIITDNFLFFCEHHPVYTLGKSGSKDNLLINEKELGERGVTFFEVGRGGDITYHGPGQLIGYPILDLENFFTDIHKYMRGLEEAIIRMLREYGLSGKRVPNFTGVWLGDERDLDQRKICAFGVKLSRWVSMHGFSLNINTDLDYFKYIIPCGIKDKQVTSMEKELGKKINTSDVKEKVLKHLSEIFEMEILKIENKLN